MDKIIDMDLGDPSPKDTENRKLYVAQVAGIHKEILEPKFRQMISATHALMEPTDNERDYDLILKGVCYALREMLRWGESMVNEQMSYQSGDNPEKE